MPRQLTVSVLKAPADSPGSVASAVAVVVVGTKTPTEAPVFPIVVVVVVAAVGSVIDLFFPTPS